MTVDPHLAALADADLRARWAALTAYIADVHQPQYTLDDAAWQAAERLVTSMNTAAELSDYDQILFNAVATMLDLVDPPDMDAAGWSRGEAMLAAYTAAVEARAAA